MEKNETSPKARAYRQAIRFRFPCTYIYRICRVCCFQQPNEHKIDYLISLYVLDRAMCILGPMLSASGQLDPFAQTKASYFKLLTYWNGLETMLHIYRQFTSYIKTSNMMALGQVELVYVLCMIV